jgi:hypothetical protein
VGRLSEGQTRSEAETNIREALIGCVWPYLQDRQSRDLLLVHQIQVTPKTRARKMAAKRYLNTMTAEAILEKSVRYDRGGTPVEVVIPYQEFIDFIEAYGLDLSKDEKEELREGISDREEGRQDRFVSSEEAKRQLGL